MALGLLHNLHRRHLDKSQRAMVADNLRDYYDQQAKERKAATQGRPKKGEEKPVEIFPPVSKSRDEAGAALGVSGKLVDAAVGCGIPPNAPADIPPSFTQQLLTKS